MYGVCIPAQRFCCKPQLSSLITFLSRCLILAKRHAGCFRLTCLQRLQSWRLKANLQLQRAVVWGPLSKRC